MLIDLYFSFFLEFNHSGEDILSIVYTVLSLAIVIYS